MIVMYRTTRMTNRSKKRIAFGLRVMVYVLLVMAMADIQISLKNTMTSTIFLVDLSDSVRAQQKKAEQLIKEAMDALPKNEQIGIVTFGKDSKVEQFVTDKNLFERLNTVPTSSATNLEKAVQAAISLYPENTAKRLVVITDTLENEGKVSNLSSTILSNKIAVSYVTLDGSKTPEVYVSNVTIPDNVTLGDVFTVTVEVESNVKTTAILTLYEGSTKKQTEKVEIQTGTNTFLFQDQQQEGGLKNYRVVIEPIEDETTVNNEFVAFTNAVAPARFLVIEGSLGESSEFVKLLKAANYEYDTVTPEIAPTKIVTLCKYKGIILLNADAQRLSEGFLHNIESYVKDYGGGVIAIGGRHSYGPGNYKDTALETILPVTMDIETPVQNPSKSVVLVIDHSGSMSDTSGNVDNLTLAKEAASSTVDLLENTDQIGVVAFDDTYSWVVPLQTVSDKETIKKQIAGITIGGGTSIYPAVNAAAESLKKNISQIKHIILLTDGQDGFATYEPLYKKLEDNFITLSTVGMGTSVDEKLMKELAYRGSGRYYVSNIGTDIPKIFMEEMVLASKSYLVNREFVPSVLGTSSLAANASSEGIPKLYGYVATTKKSMATNHMVSDTDEPILTTWQYGLGKTVAFTPDGENLWTKDFAKWTKYATIWKNIFDFVVTELEDGEEVLQIDQTADGAVLTYQTKDFQSDTTIEVVYTEEGGTKQSIVLEAISPGQFQGEIPLEKTGVYGLSVQKKEEGVVVSSKTRAVTKQYSKEYRFLKGTTSFEQFVKEVDAISLTTGDAIFSQQVVQAKKNRTITPWLLVVAMCLFFLDIVVRRVDIPIPNVLQNMLVKTKGKYNLISKWIKRKETTEEKRKKPEQVIGQKLAQDAVQQTVEIVDTSKKRRGRVEKETTGKTAENGLNTSQLLKRQQERNK